MLVKQMFKCECFTVVHGTMHCSKTTNVVNPEMSQYLTNLHDYDVFMEFCLGSSDFSSSNSAVVKLIFLLASFLCCYNFLPQWCPSYNLDFKDLHRPDAIWQRDANFTYNFKLIENIA